MQKLGESLNVGKFPRHLTLDTNGYSVSSIAHADYETSQGFEPFATVVHGPSLSHIGILRTGSLRLQGTNGDQSSYPKGPLVSIGQSEYPINPRRRRVCIHTRENRELFRERPLLALEEW